VRLFRSCLALLLFAGLVSPAGAQAATRMKTKIVFTNVPDYGYYSAWWSLDASSAPSPVARARLMYYRPSAKKWVGYSNRPVSVVRDSGFEDYTTVARVKTDRLGRFSFTMARPSFYTAKYGGGSHSLKSSAAQERSDWVSTESTTVATASSVDATRTRISIESTYRYNPYVPASPGMDFLVIAQGTDARLRTVGTAWAADTSSPLTGYGHASLDLVLANASLVGAHLRVVPRVEYYPPLFYYTDGTEDSLFGVPVTASP
jgi:hypothetical protein